MDLPDCPPGAEGYQDSVYEIPKKLEDACTKAEQEFQDHLNSLKIRLEDESVRCMVERRGRDISGKWIYLCYPCAAMCSGESILQTHISGKKHKSKLSMRTVWPMSIYEEHPYIQNERGGNKATDKVLQKMAEEVDLHNKNPNELDMKYNKYRSVRCHLQDSLDNVKAPLLGLEYLVEHPPEQPHHEPTYVCVICNKQGHPRTIINHLTCFWHRYNYLVRHYTKACALLAPFRGQQQYREGVSVIMNRLAQRIQDKYGRMQPVNIDKEEYDRDKERIHQWLFKGHHFSEQIGPTFEEVVDVDLITSLHKSNVDSQQKSRARDPSPPIVAAPSKPQRGGGRAGAGGRAGSAGALSDVSDEAPRRPPPDRHARPDVRKPRFEPYADKRRASPPRHRYTFKNTKDKSKPGEKEKKAPNYEYKLKLADEMRKGAEDSAKKTLAYHEKNPEKHPLYPEEWKKFWNRRYKEIQAEGKDPSKHDFKPEWIVFWTTRMKELHDEELRVNLIEIYRKLCLTPPDMNRRSESKISADRDRRRSPEVRRRSPDVRRRSPEVRRRSPEVRRRSPEVRRRSPEVRRRSPEVRRRSPDVRRRSPERRRSPFAFHREHRSPEHRLHSPLRHLRTRSRSPVQRHRSPARTHITLESVRRSRSPLSRRGEASRNRSPLSRREEAARNRSPQPAPALQTVMISDDELKPDDGLSPWNSDNDLDSLGSLPDAKSPSRDVRARSHASSMVSSRTSRSRLMPRQDYPGRAADPQDLGPPENVVATLRMLVALEDYLGSLGPKIVDLLTEALKLEKERANSSEQLLSRDSALVLMETAKEKLKGAAQAGLVGGGAAPAVRAAVVRVAATLHAADTRTKKLQASAPKAPAVAAAAVPVAGVGSVDRAQIAQQMAAALVAQGKTDVSSEELAQLVDAVVGMAEAKKRDAEIKKKVDARAMADKSSRPAAAPAPVKSGTASALQMLQSAYDENDKKAEKEDAPDAMDGLSDSDLETLLKNFNELSAEEQHSLIAYLKKLEAREPQRVERLRQYVSAAATATAAPVANEPPAEVPKEKVDVAPVTIESDDDDDYTVEEVFQSATKKVKENQIRQEMEIVKKSLEGANTVPDAPEPSKNTGPSIDLTNMTSATDLLALVQASIQAKSSNPSPLNPAPDVVSTSTQPRSFGDLPESAATPVEAKQLNSFAQLETESLLPTPQLQSSTRNMMPAQNINVPQNSMNIPQHNMHQNEMHNIHQNDMQNMHQNEMHNIHQNDMQNMHQNDINMNDDMEMSPQDDMNMPQHNMNMPQHNMDMPQHNMDMPQHNMNIPQHSMNMPQHNMNMPQHNMNMPQHNMNMPQFNTNMPPNNMNIPLQNNMPQHNMNMPQQHLMQHQQQSNFGNQGYRPQQPNQMNLGGNRNFQNDQFNKPSPWEQRDNNMSMPANNMQDNRGGPPSRGNAYDNFGGQDSYNQGGGRGNFNGRMQDKNPRPQMNKQFGNQGNNFNNRGRGGRGNMRGRGRGYY